MRTGAGRIIHEDHDTKAKPERNATVSVLYHDSQLPVKEIARQFNISPSRVVRIAHRERGYR